MIYTRVLNRGWGGVRRCEQPVLYRTDRNDPRAAVQFTPIYPPSATGVLSKTRSAVVMRDVIRTDGY